MLYAKTPDGEKVLPVKGMEALCPLCNGEVIAKCGMINIHHWAHKSIENCDEWDYGESDWHLSWKALFPADNVEKTIIKDGITHRADVLGNTGIVIELQHSPLSPEKIRERELFYENMVWVFDIHQSRIYRVKNIDNNIFCFRWLYPKPSLKYCTKPIYFDIITGKNNKWLLKVISIKKYHGFGIGSWITKDEFISTYR